MKVYRLVASGCTHKVTHHKKLSSMIMSNARRATTRTSKLAKDNQIKARRITREMLLYWKRNEKEEGVSRRRAEKEALDKVKAEEERKEAVRHAKKLEFLLTQTELFSHFVGNKLKSKCMEFVVIWNNAHSEIHCSC
jgi:DNA helicase INO80